MWCLLLSDCLMRVTLLILWLVRCGWLCLCVLLGGVGYGFDWLVDIVVLFSSVVTGLLFYVSWLVRWGECCVSLIAFCVVYG